MIAEVYPIKRLPRRFSTFDYEIPASMKVERGSLVYIPFRNITLRGIVKLTKDSTDQTNLKPITKVLDPNFVSTSELELYENLASRIVQSVSAVLDNAFLPERKRGSFSIPVAKPGASARLRQSEALHIQNMLTRLRSGGQNFFQITDLAQATGTMDAYLRSLSDDDQVLILTPHIHDANEVAQALANIHSVHQLDSRTTKIRRADIASAWRAGGIKTLVATRVGAMLPAKKLKAIFVLRPSSPEHRQYDRNPRFNATELARNWSNTTEATLAFFDSTMTLSTQEQFRSNCLLPLDFFPKIKPINLKHAAETADFVLLPDLTLKATQKALQNGQKVLFSYNRKGVAPRLVCRDCNHLVECQKCHGIPTVWERELRCHRCGQTEPIPLRCPKCRGTEISSRGIGNREIVRQLQKRFPTETISIAEKGSEFNQAAPIIVATQFYFENLLNRLDPPNFGLVAELAADIGLSEPYFNAVEKTLIRLSELRGIAWRAKAEFLVQTWSPEIIGSMFNNPKEILDNESQVRRHFLYPPFGTMWRISIRGRANEANELLTNLQNELAQAFPNIKQAFSVTKKPFLEIRSPKEITDRINQTLQKLPDSFIIETNPIESL